jgi:DNA processing protein
MKRYICHDLAREVQIEADSAGGPDVYPRLLREIKGAPERLRFCGDLSVAERPCFAIVGMRRATARGEALAFQIAKEMSQRGVCIVSGLAYGIDAAAHRGALEGCGGTIAVLAQGLPEIRPPRHRHLAEEIVAAGGAVICEKEFGSPFFKTDYLVRNRLISGLSHGVLVVEAAHKSGAKNTVSHALTQGRETFAIPGRVTDVSSGGTNSLIAGGAQLVTCTKDIFAHLGWTWKRAENMQLNGYQKEVYEILKRGPRSAAELGECFDGRLRQLYQAVGELELQGFILRGKDLRYVAC